MLNGLQKICASYENFKHSNTRGGPKMTIRMMNPVARPHREPLRNPVRVAELQGQRLGLLFNGHVSAVNFWAHLEDLCRELYHPQSVTSLRKENTFAPAAAESEIAQLARTDLALVGVGA
jgi:hypothetical protein